MNNAKAFLISGLACVIATSTFAESVSYVQTGTPQGTCNSLPDNTLCDASGPQVTETDVYDPTTRIFTMTRDYGNGFKSIESVSVGGHWTSPVCFAVDPNTLVLTGPCKSNDNATVKVIQKAVYGTNGTITITEHGQLIINKNANPIKFPKGASMMYSVEATYTKSTQ